MNELRRTAYLEALGVDSYVSRTQLPGAAVTRRLAIVATNAKATAVQRRVDSLDEPEARAIAAPRTTTVAGARPDFAVDVRSKSTAVESPREPLQRSEPVPRFSLITIVAGDWLWLEELHGMPLTTMQVQLVQAMARALGRGVAAEQASTVAGAPAAKPDIAQFDWPMHTNRQLDLGEEAARASVAAFISRRLEQHRCRGLILLGTPCVARLSVQEIKSVTVRTAGSAEILASPALKRQVWQDLQPLLSNA